MSTVVDPNERDAINFQNYPELRLFKPRILEILDFVDEVVAALAAYQQQKIAYIDVLISDIADYQQKVRELNSEMRDFHRVPFPILVQLRVIETQLGLFKSQPEKFREYYIRPVEYDSDEYGGDFE